MQPIAILCPSDTELAPFLPLLTELREHEQAMLRIYQGRLDGLPVVALYSGVCKVNTALAVQLLLDRFGAGAIINCGTCGGMAPEARLFETVITTESAYHDVAGDILTDFHPWMPTVWFPSDPGLLAAARRVADRRQHLLLGRTVSGEQFITQENRDRIRQCFGALSVDMESAAAAHVCYVNRVPFLAVRTVTDTAAEAGEEVFDRNCARASEISAGVVREILREWRPAGDSPAPGC